MSNEIPAEERMIALRGLFTSYFDHGDITTRDPSIISFYVPGQTIAPSIYSMPKELLDEMADFSNDTGVPLVTMELSFLLGFVAGSKACMDRVLFEGRNVDLKGKVAMVVGDKSISYNIFSLWHLEDEEKKRGGGYIKITVMKNANHFVSAFLSLVLVHIVY